MLLLCLSRCLDLPCMCFKFPLYYFLGWHGEERHCLELIEQISDFLFPTAEIVNGVDMQIIITIHLIKNRNSLLNE